MNQIETSHRLQRPAFTVPGSLGSIVANALRYWPSALVVFLLVAVTGTIIALSIPPRYRSEARVLALPSDYYSVRNKAEDRAGAEDFKPEEVMNVEMQLLSSQDIQRAALVRAGLRADNEENVEAARKAFASNLTIAQVAGANVIELSYRASHPASAQAFLDNLLAVYFETRARVLTSGRVPLLARQRDAAARELDAANDALAAFQARNNIADIDAQIAGAVQLDTALRQDQSVSLAQLSESSRALGQLRSTASRVPRTVELFRDDSEATKAVADMQSQVLQLQAKRSDLAGRYMAGSPLITQVDKQIAGLENAIAKRGGKLREARRIGRNSYYDATQDQLRTTGAALSGQSAKLGQLAQEIGNSSNRLRALNGIAGEVAKLKLRRDVATDRYRALATQADDARARELEAQTGSTNVRVIQKPTRPNARDNSIALMIAAALFAGVLLGLLTLLLRAATRDTILTPQDVSAALDLPVLMDARTPAAGQDSQGASLIDRLRLEGEIAPGLGRVIALVGTHHDDYADVRALVLAEFTRHRPDCAVAVTFRDKAGASGNLQRPKITPVSGQLSRIDMDSHGWSAGGTGEAMLGSLRDGWQWIVLIVPPATDEDMSRNRAVAIAGDADDVILLIRTATARKAAVGAAVRALAQVGKRPVGVILTGRR